MVSHPRKIPIANIFYMLCYAWDILPENEESDTNGSEEFKDIYEFLGNLLADKIRLLIAKGFYREYRETKDELMTLRGKIDVSDSIRRQSYHRKKLVCIFDDFTPNILFHQIVRYTLYRLILYHPEMNELILDKIQTVYQYFEDIGEQPPTKQNLEKLRYDRNNMHYLLIMRICELLYECHLANESGNSRFQDYEEDDKKMARLFEAFLRNFYKHEARAHGFKVRHPRIRWKDQNGNPLDSNLLPWMLTDIVIERNVCNDRDNDDWLIIDAKYYSRILVESYTNGHSDGKKKFHAGHLYQMYSYLSNWDFKQYPGRVKGLLIYPQVYEAIEEEFHLAQDKQIRVATVDLYETDWNVIKTRLLSLVTTK